MTDAIFSAQFEEEMAAALSAPAASPQFVASLREQLDAQANRQPAKPAPVFRLRPLWTTAWVILLALTAAVLLIGPQRVLAAVSALLGYIPGVGYVQTDAPLRVVEIPEPQQRDGFTVTINQGVADAQRTVLVFSVEGLEQHHRPTSEDVIGCIQNEFLRLPNGSELHMTEGEGKGWGSGYQSRFEFEPVPADINDFSLVIPCIHETLPGVAPENWEIPLHLVPAPPELTVLPVMELSDGTQAPVETPLPAVITPGDNLLGIAFNVDSVVELDSGYVLQGSLTWQQEGTAMIGFSPYFMELTDPSGARLPLEMAAPDESSDLYTQKKLTWAVQTGGKGSGRPLTLTLPAVSVDKPVQMTFDIDLGENPQDGQTWELNRDLTIEGRTVRLVDVTLDHRADDSYNLEFHFNADPQQMISLSVTDLDNRSARLGGGGGGDSQGSITSAIYFDYQPGGVRHISVQQISYMVNGPWQVTLDLPPAPEGEQTQPAIDPCLTEQNVQQMLTEPAAPLPAGLGGRLLVEGPALEGETFPTLYVINLDGSGKTRVAPGGWGALSPDGARVAYVYRDGMHLADLSDGSNTLLPWSQGNDYHPVWSPDGEKLAFVRGAAVHTARLDGSELQPVPGLGDYAELAGWTADGSGLLVTTMGAEGAHLQTVDLQSGALQELFVVNNAKGGFVRVSPNGLRIAYHEKVFGMPNYGVYATDLNGSQPKLVAAFNSMAALAGAWSPDSHWLLVNAMLQKFNSTEDHLFLLNPDTCQAVSLPWLDGAVDGWSAAP